MYIYKFNGTCNLQINSKNPLIKRKGPGFDNQKKKKKKRKKKEKRSVSSEKEEESNWQKGTKKKMI